MNRKSDNILGVKIVSTPKMKVLREIRQKLAKFNVSGTKYNKLMIVTPNPEQVIRAQSDPVYKKILNSAEISIPDGVGLISAYKFQTLPKVDGLFNRVLVYFLQGLGVGISVILARKWLTTEAEVIRGRDLFIDLIKLANKKGWKVVLLGDKMKSAQKAAAKIELSYKSVKLEALMGPDLDDDANPVKADDKELESKAVKSINKFKPHLLFVGFRAPVQEKWLHRLWNNLDIGAAMVVGGTFDYASEKYRTPPRWIADAGLEWLWRLAIGKQKAKRVFRAFPEFPLRVYWEKVVNRE